MRRKAPAPTIDTSRLLDALRVHFSAIVIYHDKVQADGFEQARELLYPRVCGSALNSGDDVERQASAHSEFALTNVSDRARSPHV